MATETGFVLVRSKEPNEGIVIPGASFYSYIKIVVHYYQCKLGLHQFFVEEHQILSGDGQDEQVGLKYPRVLTTS